MEDWDEHADECSGWVVCTTWSLWSIPSSEHSTCLFKCSNTFLTSEGIISIIIISFICFTKTFQFIYNCQVSIRLSRASQIKNYVLLSYLNKYLQIRTLSLISDSSFYVLWSRYENNFFMLKFWKNFYFEMKWAFGGGYLYSTYHLEERYFCQFFCIMNIYSSSAFINYYCYFQYSFKITRW